jgi:hypothetical protein
MPPGAVIFGPNANCTLDICPVQYSVYGYRPGLAVNASFIALFGLAGAIHIFLGIRWRTWFFMASNVVGCLSAILGYIGRVMLYYNPFNFPAFMLQISTCNTMPGMQALLFSSRLTGFMGSVRNNRSTLLLCRYLRHHLHHNTKTLA